MGHGISLLILALAYAILIRNLGQKAELAALTGPFPARQIAYNMRLYHQAAIAYKRQNPQADGALPLALPNFLNDWRFVACADANSVVTMSQNLGSAENRDLGQELLRQSLLPPELGIISPSAYFLDGGKIAAGFAAGIGVSDGNMIQNGFGPVTPACAIPAGSAAIQTRLAP